MTLRAPLAGLAAILLGHALQVSNGFYDATAFVLLAAAIMCAALALGLPGPLGRVTVSTRSLELLLAAGLLWQFVAWFRAEPGIHLDRHPEILATFRFRLSLCVLAVVALAVSARHRLLKHVVVLAMVAAHFYLGAWILGELHEPPIDVFWFQHDAVEALARGENPYAITFRNIYGDAAFYGPGLVVDGRLQFGYPYPPLGLALATPSQLVAGDARFAQLLAIDGAALLIAYLRPGRPSALAAAVFLFTPRCLYVLQMSWTEPYVCLFAALAMFVAVRRASAFPYAAGLFIAAKQYVIVGLPLVVLLLPGPWTGKRLARQIGDAVIVAAVVTLPFLIVGPHAFVQSVVLLHLNQPFREDSLSFLAIIGDQGRVLGILTLAAILGGLALARARAPRTPTGFALSTAVVLFAVFAFGTQAFCNYYFLVVAMLCAAVAAEVTDPSSRS